MDRNVIPLEELVRNFAANRSALEAHLNDPKEDTKVACLAALRTLEALWNHPDPIWAAIRKRVVVGVLKELKGVANTSVTSGIVVSRQAEVASDLGIVAILNCGTGGVRGQVYDAKLLGGVRALQEYKPRELESKDGAISVSSLNVPGLYKGTLSAEQVRTEVDLVVDQISKIYPDAPVFAAVTGDIRAAFFKASEDDKGHFEDAVAEVFQELEGFSESGSPFMSQQQEARFEHLATANLYRFVERIYKCVMAFGIGRGSCQLGNGETSLGISFGMNNAAKMLEELPKAVAGFDAAAFACCVGPSDVPVIALKSGCLIYLDKASKLPDAALVKATLFGGAPFGAQDARCGEEVAPTQVVFHAAAETKGPPPAAAAAAEPRGSAPPSRIPTLAEASAPGFRLNPKDMCSVS